MTLKKYKEKRKFTHTLEPIPKISRKLHRQLHFVIQKHDASRLHYDFRLEVEGVLKSWAVPKGPSLNPAEKRLAIMVEDHPFEYRNFEGIIPKGNYGAGKVMIWDEGTYEPVGSELQDSEENMLKGLEKGHIHFVLHGEKLKGAFSLIKLRGTQQKNNWILIKNSDQFSSQENILESIKTKKISMPTQVKPMLAKLCTQPFDEEGWIFEIKWDGFRIISYLIGKNVQLISRHFKNYNEIFSSVCQELSQLKIHAIFDGEMVVVNDSGQSRFQLLQQFQKTGIGQLIYYIFDVIWYEGQDLRGLPLEQRKKLLKQVIPSLDHVRISDYIETHGKDFFKIARTHGLEGIMAKDLTSTYLEGIRSQHWLKIKAHQRQEAVIAGFTAPRKSKDPLSLTLSHHYVGERGSHREFGALILGVYEKGQLKYIGHAGGGFNEETLHSMKKRLDKLIQASSPFESPPKTNMPVTWVKPQLLCEVSFAEWTADGRMRQPIFLGLREDKLARSVFHEKAQEPPLHHQPVQLTHLDKIYWPKERYTKKDLIEYYQSIASLILPYLKDRPEVLNRYPNGISGKHFYHKNLEQTPDWIMTRAFYSESVGHDINYLVCQNEKTLLYMINLGCIEVNPWLSRIKTPDKPDFCVIDLDPEAIGFEAVILAARSIHRLLKKIGADHYCKTSGATGLHICIPLGAQYTYEQSKNFAQLIVSIIHSELPEITSIVRSPEKRQQKVYLDYLQNRRGQTLAAPYSVRPRPGATVSTPLHWSEVRKGLNPQKFTIATIHARLDKLGDVWSPVLSEGIDLKDCLEKLQKHLQSSCSL